MQIKGCIKILPCKGLLLSFYELMNIEMVLKSRSYILDLDRVKLSLGIFFFLNCLMESFFYQLSGSTFIFVKNTHQKAANLMFRQILPVAKVPWLFLEVQYNFSVLSLIT